MERPAPGGAFLWRGGSMVELRGLPGQDATAVSVNDRGLVLGRSGTEPVIWQNGSLVDLVGRGIGTSAGNLRDIDNAGQLAGGYYFTPGQPGAALFVPSGH